MGRLSSAKNFAIAARASAFALTMVLGLAACKQGGGSVSSGTGGGTSFTGSLAITSIYPTSSGNTWTPIVLASRYYIKGLALTIEGTCSAGINTIAVNEGAADYPETATCDSNGNFVWTKTYASDATSDKPLALTGKDVSNAAITGATASVLVRIDNTLPAQVAITAPATNPYINNSLIATYLVTGTCSADTVKITSILDGAVIIPTGTTWSHTVTLVDNASLNFTFYAWDLAGNQSVAKTQTMTWAPIISLSIAGIYPATGEETDGGTGYRMENTMLEVQQTTTNATVTLDTGFNTVINNVRAN